MINLFSRITIGLTIHTLIGLAFVSFSMLFIMEKFEWRLAFLIAGIIGVVLEVNFWNEVRIKIKNKKGN